MHLVGNARGVGRANRRVGRDGDGCRSGASSCRGSASPMRCGASWCGTARTSHARDFVGRPCASTSNDETSSKDRMNRKIRARKAVKRVRVPRVPMLPGQIPAQGTAGAALLPARPRRFEGKCDFIDRMPEENRPSGSPRNVEYLGSVEWASGPNNTRLDSYYLNPRGAYWLVWNRYRDENDSKPRWGWEIYAYGPRRGVDAKDAALYLLMDAWRIESGSERYDMIDDTGLLSADEISAIAAAVWPDDD